MRNWQPRTKRCTSSNRPRIGSSPPCPTSCANPLAAVLAATELLGLDARDHPTLAVLERQVNALVRMTDDLLNASRGLTGRLEVARRPLDLRTTVEAVVHDIRPEYVRTDRTLQVSLPAQPVPVDGDTVGLSRMLGNLLGNARKYTRPGGTVRVELAAAGDHATLTVRDDGIGLTPPPRIGCSRFLPEQFLQE